ncbi:MAG: hypothetical protein GC205_04440 [Bacteroidetes bacterium]|nr:hypothetical protein [Bacteroidota bacterium]
MPINISLLQTLTGHRAAIFALSSAPRLNAVLSGCGDGLVASWALGGMDTPMPEAATPPAPEPPPAPGPAPAPEPAHAMALARLPANVFSLCWIPETQQLLVGGMHGGAFLLGWDAPVAVEGLSGLGQSGQEGLGERPPPSGQSLPAGKVLKTLSNPNAPVFSILHRPQEQQVWMACGDGMLRVYNTRNWALLRQTQISRERLRSLSPEPDGERIAVCASDGCVYLLNSQNGAIQQVLEGHEQSVFCAAWMAPGGPLVTGSRDARLRVWQGKDQLLLDHVIPAHLFTINAMALDPSGRWLATASRDKTIKLWAADDFRLLKVLERPRYEAHSRSVNALLWQGHNGLLISASDDRSIKVWQVQEPTPQNAP